MSEEPNGRWHLDKKVPITIIAALIVQTGTFVWWASAQTAAIADHERRILLQERMGEARMTRDLAQEGRLARIEEGIRALLETAGRLERRIDGGRP